MLANAIDTLFAGQDWDNEPGCAAALVLGGAVVWRRDFGLADLGTRARITPASRFRLCSVTKPMAAVVLLALSDSGLLSLDDRIDVHVPELAGTAMPTIAELLAMKSGLYETYDLNWLAGGAAGTVRFDATQSLRLILAQAGRSFEPATRTLYCNSNYALLQLAAERVTGQPFGALLAEYVFAPAGMTRSLLGEGPAHNYADVGLAYTRKGHRFEVLDPDVATGAAGAVIAPLGDLIAFVRWLQNDPRGWLSRLATRTEHRDGSRSGYALGLSVQALAPYEIAGHAGATGGWACDFVLVRERRAAAIVLGARNDLSWIERTREMLLTALGVPGDLGATPRLIRPNAPPERWRACYASIAAGSTVDVIAGQGEISVDGRRMPEQPDGSYARAVGVEPVVYRLVNGDTPPAVIERREGNVAHVYHLADPTTCPPAKCLVGCYASPDLPHPLRILPGTAAEVTVEVGPAWPASAPLPLRPIAGPLFRAENADGTPHELHLVFVLPASGGPATAVCATLARTIGVRFRRTDEIPVARGLAPNLLRWTPP